MFRDALISRDDLYRYELIRTWGESAGAFWCWVLLNPSTADAEKDDHTIRRCINLTESLSRGSVRSIVVVNLYAYRATRPRDLNSIDDPVGPDNEVHVNRTISHAVRTIAGWGCPIERVKKPPVKINADIDVYCLGSTVKGHPRHPRSVSKSPLLIPFTPQSNPRCR